MVKNKEKVSCFDLGESCCKVEAVIGVDERGQMVLPKEIRQKAGIRPGDKLAVISWGTNDGCRCISLIRTEELAGMVKNLLGPMLEEMVTK